MQRTNQSFSRLFLRFRKVIRVRDKTGNVIKISFCCTTFFLYFFFSPMTIPNIEEFDVFPNSGFLPSKLPLERLPQEYYQPWENIVNNLPSLILTKRIRAIIDKLPVLETTHLTSDEEYRRAYQILGFLAHAYIWGTDTPTDKLPSQIATPWIKFPTISDYRQ